MAMSQGHGQWRGAAIAVALLTTGTPLAAQTAPATTATPPTAPTPPAQTPPATTPPAGATPAPAANDSVGPATLRDFNLDGTVIRRAEPVAPAPAAPSASSPAPASTTTRSAPAARAPAPSPPRDVPEVNAGRVVPDANLPLPGVALPSPPQPGFAGDDRASAPLAPPMVAPRSAPESDGLPWPWLLAGLALALGALFFARQRRQRTDRYAGAFAGKAAGGDAAAAASPVRATPAMPAVRPKPAPPTPAPARALQPERRIPSIAARPAAAPKRQAPASPSDGGGIVASGLRPRLDFELHPIRAETDAARGAALLFDVVVVNNGSAPARDVLVEAQLINAGPGQDEEIGRFFREPVGSGDRLPVIPPMGRVSIKSRLTIAGADLVPVEIEGRPLFVPLVAFNALYRWSGGDEQSSASFLVGRGSEEGGKMAPFRLDLGARSWSGLGARPHSMGLQR